MPRASSSNTATSPHFAKREVKCGGECKEALARLDRRSTSRTNPSESTANQLRIPGPGERRWYAFFLFIYLPRMPWTMTRRWSGSWEETASLHTSTPPETDSSARTAAAAAASSSPPMVSGRLAAERDREGEKGKQQTRVVESRKKEMVVGGPTEPSRRRRCAWDGFGEEEGGGSERTDRAGGGVVFRATPPGFPLIS